MENSLINFQVFHFKHVKKVYPGLLQYLLDCLAIHVHQDGLVKHCSKPFMP